jgi:hypothetical protein
MTTFDYYAEAGLFPSKTHTPRRKRVGYKRFTRAADAIRFAIEELPPKSLTGTWLEVGEDRFDHGDIRRLYDDAAYPLERTERAEPRMPTPAPLAGGVTSLTRRPLWWSRS